MERVMTTKQQVIEKMAEAIDEEYQDYMDNVEQQNHAECIRIISKAALDTCIKELGVIVLEEGAEPQEGDYVEIDKNYNQEKYAPSGS
jgi:hypothetical protein